VPESVGRSSIRAGLAHVETLGDVLSVWEIDFVDDVGIKMGDPTWEPTERQVEKINEIVERY